jgi:hypothetical protein
VKRLLQLGRGIVTSVGGFLEIGSIATSTQAGAQFGYQLIWAIVLGRICIAFLVEMSGRFAACSRRAILGAIRERFGARAFAVPLQFSIERSKGPSDSVAADGSVGLATSATPRDESAADGDLPRLAAIDRPRHRASSFTVSSNPECRLEES